MARDGDDDWIEDMFYKGLHEVIVKANAYVATYNIKIENYVCFYLL